MNVRRNILWIDCLGALLVGALVLIACPILAELHDLPLSVIVFLGIMNLAYGCYSLTLARQTARSKIAIRALAIANVSWILVCFAIVFAWRDSISVFGVAHLVGEGIYVCSLGVLEWRWQEFLQFGDSSSPNAES